MKKIIKFKKLKNYGINDVRNFLNKKMSSYRQNKAYNYKPYDCALLVL